MEGLNQHLRDQAKMAQGAMGGGQSGGEADEFGDSGSGQNEVPITGDIAGFGEGFRIEKVTDE